MPCSLPPPPTDTHTQVWEQLFPGFNPLSPNPLDRKSDNKEVITVWCDEEDRKGALGTEVPPVEGMVGSLGQGGRSGKVAVICEALEKVLEGFLPMKVPSCCWLRALGDALELGGGRRRGSVSRCSLPSPAPFFT